MMNLWLNILVGFIGALAGGIVTWFIGVRQRRSELVLSMHEQFNSIEMVALRHRATQLLDEHPGETFRELRTSLGRAAMVDVWSVQYFYQRLWLLVRHHHVRRSLVPELFGDILTWWVERYFRERLFQLRTEPAIHVEQLWRWMQKHSTPSQRARWSHQIDS